MSREDFKTRASRVIDVAFGGIHHVAHIRHQIDRHELARRLTVPR